MRTRSFHPVIHVKDLDQTLKNVEICLNAETQGFFLINHRINFKKFLPIIEEIRNRYPHTFLGVNVLGDVIPPVVIKQLPDVNAYWCDNPGLIEGLTEQNMMELLNHVLRTELPKCKLFGGVAFKYQEQPKDLVGMTKLATQYIDVITTTGDRTGDAADLEKIKTMREAMGNHPLAIASGISLKNMMEFLPYINHFLVATNISIDEYNLDPHLVQSMSMIINARNWEETHIQDGSEGIILR